MNLTGNQIAIGAVAGLATALLSVGLAYGSALGTAAYFLSPLPIMVAGLGWRFAACVVAAIVAAGVAAALVSPSYAVVLFATTLAPALVGNWHMALARPAEEIGGQAGKVAWFPLADTLMRMAIAVALGFVIVGYMIGYGAEFVRANIDLLVGQMKSVDPTFVPAAGFEERLARLVTPIAPFMQSAFWMLMLTANVYAATRIARLSGGLARPADNWPQTLRLPRAGLIIFAVALAAAFAGGGFGHAAAALAGAFGGGFAMAGLAMLHWRTTGKPGRPALLVLAYIAAIFFLPAAIIAIVAGLFDTARFVPLSNGGARTPNQPNA